METTQFPYEVRQFDRYCGESDEGSLGVIALFKSEGHALDFVYTEEERSPDFVWTILDGGTGEKVYSSRETPFYPPQEPKEGEDEIPF